MKELRLWRDVHRSILQIFSATFRELEDEGQLDPLNEVDCFCLQTVFLPLINQALAQFVTSWNGHALSTEHMQTPMQLFYAGQLARIKEQNSSDSDEVSNDV